MSTLLALLLAKMLKEGFNQMKTQQQVFDFIKEKMGHSTLLAIAGDMTPFTNDSFDNARFLSQLLFWVDDSTEWVPIQMKEWKEVAHLSRYAIEKARYFFYNMGVLEYCVRKDSKGNPVSHYRLDFKALMSKMNKFFKDNKPKQIVTFSGFADCFKRKSEQIHNTLPTNTYPQYKEKLESKNIGQSSKNETREERKKRLERLYL